MTPLREIVEEAYVLFKRQRPLTDGVCDCCMYDDVKERLLDWAPCDIPEYDLRDWYFAASDVPFPLATIRWFLPRIMDGLASGQDLASVGEEVALKRLGDAGFPGNFTEAEVEIVQRFALAMIEEKILTPRMPGDAGWQLDTLLCLLSLGGIDLLPVLVQLDEVPVEAFIDGLGSERIVIEIGFTAFWEPGPAREAALEWFHSEKMAERLLNFACGEAGSDAQRAIAFRVYDHVVNARDCRPDV